MDFVVGDKVNLWGAMAYVCQELGHTVNQSSQVFENKDVTGALRIGKTSIFQLFSGACNDAWNAFGEAIKFIMDYFVHNEMKKLGLVDQYGFLDYEAYKEKLATASLDFKI